MTISGNIMMALGNYRFGLPTAAYQQLQRTHTYRWPEQQRMGREPAMQFTGPGGETIELEGVIHPHYKGGLGQLDAMRAEAATGKPLLLVDGRGRQWGKYCIMEIRETQTLFAAGGVPLKQQFSMRLARYGEDAR